MSYTSLEYFAFLLLLIIVYYILPKRFRWMSLLAGSLFFYWQIMTDKRQIFILLFSLIVTYFCGLILQKLKKSSNIIKKRLILFTGIGFSTLPLLAEKAGSLLLGNKGIPENISILIPIGLSFYSLQLIAYLVDIYKGKITVQVNPLKFTLFATFFPQIIQGPIPRYGQLKSELFEGHDFKQENLMKGIQLVIWGFFLKFMIADKASIVVNTVFDNFPTYRGTYIWIAAILYSLQLYTDFLSCTTISQGVSKMLGINLTDNFNRPYFSTSVKDFWRRWHMSLSLWLRDYIYIPLGGNKFGLGRKWLNLLVTFGVSGLWHGDSLKYIFWGLLHSVYQICGEMYFRVAKKHKPELVTKEPTVITTHVRRIRTFFLVMIAWVVFRAASFKTSLKMIRSMFADFNPWILGDDSVFNLGLGWKEFAVLILSLLLLLVISTKQEAGVKIRDWFAKQNIAVRWITYLLAIWSIWIFGSYGFGFNAQDFIYGGF